MYHLIRMSSAPTRQDPSGRSRSPHGQAGIPRTPACNSANSRASLPAPKHQDCFGWEEHTKTCAGHGWRVTQKQSGGGAYLTANYRPQKHMQLKLQDCVATREQHVIAMPNPRPIHEEKGSGCRSIGM